MADKESREAQWKEQLHSEMEELKTVRDELKVKMHLARADIKDAWNDLEERWPEVESNLKRFEGRATQAIDELGEATRSLFADLKKGYQKVKKDL